MRIAVFIKSTTFHKGYGGLETQNKVLCEGLAKNDHKVVVFSPLKEFNETSRELNGVLYIFIKSDYYGSLFSSFKKDSWPTKSYETFQQYHKEKPFNLIIGQSASAEGLIETKKEHNIPIISIAHGSTVAEFKTFFGSMRGVRDLYWLVRNFQYMIRQFFGRQRRYVLGSNKVVAVSKAVKDFLIEETFISEENIVVINNGIDPEIFEEGTAVEKDSDNINLVYVGRVERPKGVFELVDFIQEIPKGNVLLNIVGSGPDIESLKEYVKKKELDKQVIFHGKVSHNEVVEKLKLYDIFVFYSKRIEGFPMVLPEAMLAGLPIVATNIGGIGDAIVNGETGYLVQKGSKKDFIEKVITLIKSPSLREEMGENAKIKAMCDFTLDNMISKYEKLIKEVCK